MTFQVVHLASEVLLKGVAWELGRARAYLEEGDFANAARLIHRAQPHARLSDLDAARARNDHAL